MASPFRAIWKEDGDYVFTTGDNHTFSEQVDFHNAGAQEYFVDMSADLPHFEASFIEQDLALSLCLYMHTRDGTFVGFSRTGVRGRRGWLGGICLVPAFRGRGAGPVLFTEYLNLLKTRASIDLLQFECITQNPRALKMYENFGCVIDRSLFYHYIEITGADRSASHVALAEETTKLDLRLPWLQHTTAYAWQREFGVILTGVHRQYVFKKAPSNALVLAVAVDVTNESPRVNAIAYNERPTAEEFMDCMRELGTKLQVRKLTFANEPEESDITPLLDAVGRREKLSQKHLTLVIERV